MTLPEDMVIFPSLYKSRRKKNLKKKERKKKKTLWCISRGFVLIVVIFKIFVYLAVLGLGCGLQTLSFGV